MVAQPPENLNPDDTEAIIAAFLNDATTQQWGDEGVNRVLEHILQQDAAYQAGEASIQHQEVIPVPAPFHGPNSPISTPTQRDEEEADDVVEENPPGIDPSLSTQEGEQTAEGATSTVHTAEGTTTAWVSVVDFNGNLSTLHEHEAAINAMAADWLDQAQQPIRDALSGWGEINHSEPPYCGLHAPSRLNKQQGTPTYGSWSGERNCHFKWGVRHLQLQWHLTGITNRQRRRDITIWGKWRRLVMTVIVRRNRSKQGSLERTCPTRRGTPRR